VCLSVCLSVGVSDFLCPVGELWKMVDLICVSIGMVTGVSRGMDELDRGGDCSRGRGKFGDECGCPIVTSGDFVA